MTEDKKVKHDGNKVLEHDQKSQSEFRHIVRIVNTDLDGNKQIIMALQKIRGIGFMFSNMICVFANIPKEKKTGYLTDDEVARLDKALSNPKASGAPVWMLNRRKDYETGKDRHIITGDLKFQTENDIKLMQKIRSYKGVRHSSGLPVRGQRTRSNFRRNKGKGLGVSKKKVSSPAPEKK